MSAEVKISKPKIYVAGPYTSNPVHNTRRAIEVGDWIWRMGGVPFVPHLTMLFDLIALRPAQDWYDYDNEWLPLCDAVYRFQGESTGADKEVALAEKLRIPVFYFLHTLGDFIARWDVPVESVLQK